MTARAVTGTEDLVQPNACGTEPQESAAVHESSTPLDGCEPQLDFEELYEAQVDFVWRSLRLLGIPPESLEDAAQDTFGVISRQLARFEGRSSVRTWIFAIVQRVASNHRRTRARKLAPLTPFTDRPGQEPTPHAHAEATEAAALVERFCADLDAERRAIFVLALLEETPAAEVAAALGIPVNTVYRRVHAMREALRRAFALQE
jgi:RNA polymerase sigma-70 factor (ECF subfamily)